MKNGLISDTNGLLLVDKPAGMTSHDVVDLVRRRIGIKKVGHAGTLDPQATGLLILLLGKWTKKFAEFSEYPKEYEGKMQLGVSTDTGDRDGSVIKTESVDVHMKNIENIGGVFKSFLGALEQIPPMYSAKKFKGKKLYELARLGKAVERKSCRVFIETLKILDISLPYVTFCVKCSKGTYIRQLVHDIGEKIGCGAHLVSLKRTKIGPFDLTSAVSLQSIKPNKNSLHENILWTE